MYYDLELYKLHVIQKRGLYDVDSIIITVVVLQGLNYFYVDYLNQTNRQSSRLKK